MDLFVQQSDSYYSVQMKPFRHFHKIWNKVPVNNANFYQLTEAILANYVRAKELLGEMRALGITEDDTRIDSLIAADV